MKPHYNVVAAVVRNNGEILCMQRGPTRFSYTSYKYEFPGGKVEPGETPRDALRRELQEELDLKRAAGAVGEKKIEMVRSADLLGLTGYVHGGCSPIGMKKFFKTTFQKEAAEYDTIMFSAGKIGYQVELPLKEVSKVIRYQLGDIVTEAQ